MNERKRRIGLLIDYLASEYSENLIAGTSKYCKENNIDLLIFTIGEIHNPSTNTYNYQYVATTAQVREENVDGIIIASGTQMHGTSKDELISYLNSYKSLPIVNISMVLKGIPSICVDCKQAFDALIQYLIDQQGCKKIGFMGVDSNSYDVKTRTSIFKEVLERNGIAKENAVFWKSNFDYNSSYKMLYDYYEKHKKFDFDAIVALNDDMAFSCMDFCEKFLHKRIPEDIIITGFDNLQRSAFSNPPLTSVDQQVNFQAYTAAGILNSILKGEKIPEIQKIKAKTILRQSSSRNIENQINFEENEFITKDLNRTDDSVSRNLVSEWYIKRSQLFNAAHFYSAMHHDVEISKIGPALTKELNSYGFQSAAIVLYENPIEMLYPFEYFNLPSTARLIAGFDYATGFNLKDVSQEVVFNPKECMLPKGYINFSGQGSIVSALYHNSIQYGYIILSIGDFDFGVYDLIMKAVANQITASLAYTQILQERSVITDKYNKLDIIANTDELTGLKNRRAFTQVGNSLMRFAESIGQTGLIVYCDMDGLKKINDTYGHEAGDTAIKLQGFVLNKNFRTNDVVARLAGDEFAIICPGLSKKQFGEIRKKIDADCITFSKENNLQFNLSISMGTVEYPNEEAEYKLQSLLALADASLYMEKREKKQTR